ncbi:MAG TPA: glycosyltransferase [Candidatus Kapabacteria bacterium]|nr:glycosyltransferase [Candidatus Kapabacteria bacterium]
MVIALLIVLVGLVVYYYVGYPVMMSLLAKLRAKPWRRDENFKPRVSVILAVYNEEAVIEACVRSISRQQYPPENLEILVGSDGSSDATNTILTRLSQEDPRVKPHLFTERRGKVPVVNELVRASTGEILVFADADITLMPNAVACHTRHYVDPSIGCVAGQLTYRSSSEDALVTSENDYMSFENKLRQNEALVHSTVGIFGGNYSIRRSEFREIPDAPICDELYSAMQVVERGLRTVFDVEAITPESFARTLEDEFKRKARFAARGFTTMAFFPKTMSGRSGIMSVILWSHKTLRYGMPLILWAILLLTVFAQLAAGVLYLTAMNVAIAACLGLFLLGGLLDRLKISIPGIKHFYWLAIMYVAFTIGAWRFFFGKERQFWTQATRTRANLNPNAMAIPEKEAVGL